MNVDYYEMSTIHSINDDDDDRNDCVYDGSNYDDACVYCVDACCADFCVLMIRCNSHPLCDESARCYCVYGSVCPLNSLLLK
jgi:hypothetical protein